MKLYTIYQRLRYTGRGTELPLLAHSEDEIVAPAMATSDVRCSSMVAPSDESAPSGRWLIAACASYYLF